MKEINRLPKLNVRFFIYELDEDNELDIIEVDEQDFLNAEGEAQYERHTVFENGVNQICLTKTNGF